MGPEGEPGLAKGWRSSQIRSEGGFPELKVLKQRVRNLIQPDMNLGHSDSTPKHQQQA